jgi:hypothetical protein
MTKMIDLILAKGEQNWQQTCEGAVTSIVSIQSYFPRAFDTETSHTSDATGFVVNAKAGLILTNRVCGYLNAAEGALELMIFSMLLVRVRSEVESYFQTKRK